VVIEELSEEWTPVSRSLLVNAGTPSPVVFPLRSSYLQYLLAPTHGRRLPTYADVREKKQAMLPAAPIRMRCSYTASHLSPFGTRAAHDE
jgi:hypothetical protein